MKMPTKKSERGGGELGDAWRVILPLYRR